MNPLKTITEIKKIVNEISQKINVPKKNWEYITFGGAIGDATPNIEVDDNGYHYIISERGNEYERKITQDINELLYWIFEGITNSMASEFVLENPHPNWEQRRTRFRKQMELLESISQKFKSKYKEEISQILKEYPFKDGLPNTLDYE